MAFSGHGSALTVVKSSEQTPHSGGGEVTDWTKGTVCPLFSHAASRWCGGVDRKRRCIRLQCSRTCVDASFCRDLSGTKTRTDWRLSLETSVSVTSRKTSVVPSRWPLEPCQLSLSSCRVSVENAVNEDCAHHICQVFCQCC